MLTDDELRQYAADSNETWICAQMARELLAARRVVEAARASLANAALVCDEDCALADAVKNYDEATR